MINFSDATLMAFADGELDVATCRAIEQAMRQDPAIAQRVAEHQALRAHVSAAFTPVPGEAARLIAPLLQTAPPRGGVVIQLSAVRASKGQAPAVPVRSAPRWSWPEWGALAVTLVLGLAAGRFALPLFEGESPVAMVNIAPGSGGALIAQGKLAGALTQASAGPAGSGVRIGLSFVSNQGNYCRSFALAGALPKPPMAGLACRSGHGWRIAAIAEDVQPASAPDGYRMAGAAMPPAILAAIDQRIAGQALDATEEQAALRRAWRR